MIFLLQGLLAWQCRCENPQREEPESRTDIGLQKRSGSAQEDQTRQHIALHGMCLYEEDFSYNYAVV